MVIDVVAVLEFFRLHFVSLVFTIIFLCFIVFLIRLNSSNGAYENFRIAHLIMRKDGTLDRKGFRETMLFLVSVYGFLYVLQKHPTMLVEYFLTMAAVWLGAHLAADKLPTLGGPPKQPPEAPKP